jgi:hypothetical protein
VNREGGQRLADLRSGRSIQAEVEEELRHAQIAFQREVGLAGNRVDFLVLGPWGGPAAALQVREPRAGQAVDRLRVDLLLARTYAEFLRGIRVLVVTTDPLAALFPGDSGVVSVSSLIARLRPLVEVRTASGQAAALIQPASTPTIFVSMPLSEEYIDTFLKAIRPAAGSVGMVAVQVGHDPATGNIVDRIKSDIRASTFVVADVSEARPSVLHEYGFAEALRKPVVAITSTGHGTLPFNVRNNTTHEYVRGNSGPLRRILLKAFRKEATAAGITLPAPRRRTPKHKP